MLITDPHFEAPDDFYEALIDAHRDLSLSQSHDLNAKLVLLLANHIGEQSALQEALALARQATLKSRVSEAAQPSTPVPSESTP